MAFFYLSLDVQAQLEFTGSFNDIAGLNTNVSSFSTNLFAPTHKHTPNPLLSAKAWKWHCNFHILFLHYADFTLNIQMYTLDSQY